MVNKLKIILALTISYIIIVFLSNKIFLANTPKLNPQLKELPVVALNLLKRKNIADNKVIPLEMMTKGVSAQVDPYSKKLTIEGDFKKEITLKKKTVKLYDGKEVTGFVIE